VASFGDAAIVRAGVELGREPLRLGVRRGARARQRDH
jgi:hypothetical protein